MTALFAYGTLMCEDIMQAVAGVVLPHEKAILQGHRRLAVKGEEYPGVLPAEGFLVEGILYYDVCGASWERLDRFEGEMYCRTGVTVFLDDSSRRDAFTYIVRPEYRDRLSNSDWSFTDFVEKKKNVFISTYGGYDALE